MDVRIFTEIFEVTLAQPHHPGVCTLKDGFSTGYRHAPTPIPIRGRRWEGRQI